MSRQFRDHNDALAAHVSFTRWITANFETVAAGWLGDRHSRYGVDGAGPSAVAFLHMIEDTLNADTVWMTHEMMDVTQRAMETFDATEPFSVERDCFIPHGFMVLPEPFYSLDVNKRKVCQRCVMWRYDPHGAIRASRETLRAMKGSRGVPITDGAGQEIDVDSLPDDAFDNNKYLSYTFDLNVPGDPLPTLRITEISYILDPDDWAEEYAPIVPEMIARGHEWGIVHATTIPVPLVNNLRDTANEGDPTSGWLRFFRVAQRIMQERIFTTERQKAARPFRREAKRYGFDFGDPRVIQLRRRVEREADPERERVRDVQWTHRWICGGHWRNQPYPSLGVTRQIWIAEHVKGPDNLPLVIKERVWNWDR